MRALRRACSTANAGQRSQLRLPSTAVQKSVESHCYVAQGKSQEPGAKTAGSSLDRRRPPRRIVAIVQEPCLTRKHARFRWRTKTKCGLENPKVSRVRRQGRRGGLGAPKPVARRESGRGTLGAVAFTPFALGLPFGVGEGCGPIGEPFRHALAARADAAEAHRLLRPVHGDFPEL
jgi:hypothetical protein